MLLPLFSGMLQSGLLKTNVTIYAALVIESKCIRYDTLCE